MSETLLMVADSERDANMLYATGLFVPDPFIFLNFGHRPLIVLNDLEIDRARKQAPHCRVVSLSAYQQKLRRSGVKFPGLRPRHPGNLAREQNPPGHRAGQLSTGIGQGFKTARSQTETECQFFPAP